MAKRSDWTRLSRAIEEITGLPPSQDQRDAFGRYLDLIVAWSRSQRLTGFRTATEIVESLFIDSLLFLPLVPARPCKLVDIGSGVGVPGIPLRIVEPGISLMVVESRRKRTSFLKTVVRELGLSDVEVLHGRAEHLVRDRMELAGRYDVVAMRSVGRVASLVPIAGTYLRPGGLCVISGPPVESDAAPVPAVPGFAAERRLIDLPPLALTRAFLVFAKNS